MANTLTARNLLPLTCLVVFFLSFFLTSSAQAKETGILLVNSSPVGAEVSINEVVVGSAPFVDAELPVGTYTVKADAGPDFPIQEKMVKVGPITPIEVQFIFKFGIDGVFQGTKAEVLETEKKTGGLQVVSLPIGAIVSINGEEIGPTPFGYTDVEVGTYDIAFTHGQKTLRGRFLITSDGIEKVIADFDKGALMSSYSSTVSTAPQTLSNLRKDLAKLQLELGRVGCDAGASDGIWGRKSANALDQYNSQRGAVCEPLDVIDVDSATITDTLKTNLKSLAGCSQKICAYTATKPAASSTAPKMYHATCFGEAKSIVNTLRRSSTASSASKQTAIRDARQRLDYTLPRDRNWTRVTCQTQYR